ncbi:MAG: 23S rRNA (pseudouridine(1915)-N(3))-methyltransferase RlmH [Burkholderiales bacterium]|nr:23S rRNA (pseudouridine(1915)-N(3))-methyltransferase RlmH [Burkholderiales bacterium]
MKLIIAAVGQRPPAWVAEGFAEYARRMPPEARIELVEIRAEPRTGGRPAQQLMAAEGRRLLAATPAGATLVALDERGRDLTTRGLAQQLERWQRDGADVVFAIGGPDGLHDEVRERAAMSLRLSSLTLPHALVRVVLAEALYRAASLSRGHPYHRE